MKDFTKDEELTYNTLLLNVRTASSSNCNYHIARLKDFVDVMIAKQNGYCPGGYEIP